MVFDGRLPSKTRCGTSQSGVPSALTCSGVLPKASASVWAKTLARSKSWCRPRGLSGWPNAMKSQGMSLVPRLAERDEVTRDELGPLVDQLVERVLAVGPR